MFFRHALVLFLQTGRGKQMMQLKIYRLETILLPQFTLVKTKAIMKEKLLLTQLSEVNVNTNTPQNVTTPLHPVLPAATVEIPTAQTVMKQFPMVISFPHMNMTMTTVLSLQNQLPKLTVS